MRPVPFLSNFLRASTRKRLWLSGGILGVFVLTLVVGNHFLERDRSVTREMLGHDFLAFYTAGSFVRGDRAHDLYNLNAVRDFEQSTAHAAGLEVGKSFGPWWNPPFYALAFEPLAALPYGRALDLWRWISLAAVIVAMLLLSNIGRPILVIHPLAALDAGAVAYGHFHAVRPGDQPWAKHVYVVAGVDHDGCSLAKRTPNSPREWSPGFCFSNRSLARWWPQFWWPTWVGALWRDCRSRAHFFCIPH